jgi:hypothetical protein
MKPITRLLAVLCYLAACNSSADRQHNLPEAVNRNLPEVVNIDKLHKTAFVPTLETPIAYHKNIIYAPTLLYAWDEVKEALKAPVKTSDANFRDFKQLNISTSHLESLLPSEYTTEVDVSGDGVIAKAFFNKSLPFDVKFQRLDDVVPFDGYVVSAFGMQRYDEDIARCAEILYYHDDDHFVLKLKPSDTSHEIILTKGLPTITSLSDAVRKTNDLIQKGKQEKIQKDLAWKYVINPDDKFTIPVIQFNIEANFESISGQTFWTGQKKHFVDIAYQRTGLILDEYGAVVESEAIATTDSGSHKPQPEYPKNMLFNKTFYIIIKHTGKPNPYFVMKVQNAELLTKSE